MNILDNFQSIKNSARHISQLSNRSFENIQIISVSKTVPDTIIQEAISSGIILFGENKVQEAKAKIPLLQGNFSFHMIGHLQSNKARDAVSLFDVIQSIDKSGTAEAVDSEAKKIGKIQKIMIQINAAGEASKSGISPHDAPFLVNEIIKLPNIELIGLMTIAPYTDNDDIIRQAFRSTKKVLDEINDEMNLNLKELSMGMSSDYAIAIEEGATMLRIGTAIFGDRQSR